jgi:DNA-binding response OmpR family regulator
MPIAYMCLVPQTHEPLLDEMMASVLVVEDEPDLAMPLVRTLEREDYHVTWASTGREALDLSRRESVDVVILDQSLPDMDGLDVCRSLRENGYKGALIMVTSSLAELDCVAGLDGGADDHMTKPFRLAELHARVRALLRRTDPSRMIDPHRDGALRLDDDARRVYAGDDEINLTKKEFEVLRLLLLHSDKVVPRGRLISEVWGEQWYGSTRTLDVTIGRLRQKLEDAGLADQVVSVRGVGFRFERPLAPLTSAEVRVGPAIPAKPSRRAAT